MAPKSILFAASAFVGAALVAAQAAPNWQYVRLRSILASTRANARSPLLVLVNVQKPSEALTLVR